MNSREYRVQIEWTGNWRAGTTTYQGCARDQVVRGEGKADIAGSSDPAFRGNAARHSPEELLVAGFPACPLRWHLHRCSANGVNVVDYRDQSWGRMKVVRDGAGRFVEVVQRPAVHISAAMIAPPRIAA